MKALLVVCALVGAALGITASCGPERPFCPNNPPEYNCINNSDAGSVGGAGGNGGNRCPNSGSIMLAGDSCMCIQNGMPPYACAF